MTGGIAVVEVFGALADPTRRDLLEELAHRGGASASALAKSLPVSRQAIAKHLQILEESGLVEGAKRGRELCFAVQPRALLATARWMERAAERWETRLDRIKRIAESIDV
jgi:DNA-binding transcriptional ArsR family regulator